MIRCEHRPLGNINTHPLAPIQHREQITVGDREGCAHQVVLAVELLGEPVKTLAEFILEDLLHFGRQRRIEQWAEAFVDFGGNEIEHFLQAIAFHRAGFRRQTRRWILIGDVLDDGWSFRQVFTVVELQQWHITFAVDRPEVTATVELLGFGIDFLCRERQTRLKQGNARGK